ncbi:hypothetical protein WH50_09415 [Pokkaliibacter plantistimulans]|uniref:Transporter n=1 Tax=Pokkaliibacter plantistimulans TaxID=1635171 RepID=A0ABX5LYX9_9GAMM|nr:AEC family transporter [Pokkaliibacter plantistimulans]PXF31516.1 hypothetical protein WH50_09415 [Pokkaliibacter plantistimulans]
MVLVNTLIPIFVLIGLGLFTRHIRLFDSQSIQVFNPFILNICLPPLFFWSTASVALTEILNLRFIAITLVASLLSGALVWWLAKRFWNIQHPADRMLLSLSGLNPNTIYMGVPLFTLLYGSHGTLPVIISSLTFNILFMGLGMALLDHLTQPEPTRIRTLLVRLFVKNPLFMPPLLGMLWSACGLPKPEALSGLMTLLAQATAPVALFTMGLSLYGQSVRGQLKPILLISSIKLLVHPLLALLLASLFWPLPRIWMEGVVLANALPAAAMVSVFALKYERQVSVVSSVIVISTLVSLLTLSGWMLILPYLPALRAH